MHFAHWFATSDSDRRGRFDINSLPNQDAMELLVSRVEDIRVFQDENGDFTDINDWEGLQKTSNGSIKCIIWDVSDSAFGDDGTYIIRPGGSMDIQWLPREVTNFSIRQLRMRGTVDTSRLPRRLEALMLEMNKFNGSFALEFLPSTMKCVALNYNEFSGSLEISAFPKGIQHFDASFNSFSGSVKLGGIPDSLEKLIINQNLFSGELDLRNIPRAAECILLHANKFQQDVLVVGDLPMNFETMTVDVGTFGEIHQANGFKLKITEAFFMIVIERG